MTILRMSCIIWNSSVTLMAMESTTVMIFENRILVISNGIDLFVFIEKKFFDDTPYSFRIEL